MCVAGAGVGAPRARVGHKGEGPLLVLNTRRLELLLGLAYRGDLRVGVDDAGDALVVDMSALARELLNDRNALLLGLVGCACMGGGGGSG